MNEKYHSEADSLSSQAIGKILRELGLELRRYESGYAVDLEAPKEAIRLLSRQYSMAEPGNDEDVDDGSSKDRAARLKALAGLTD